MAHIPDAALKDMLGHLPTDTARSLAHIVAGKVSHQVKCLGDCDGEVIAYLYPDGTDSHGRIRYRVEPAVVDRQMKLRSSRLRLDGQFGFQCWCGNDSRIARQESGALKYDGLPPSRDGLADIYRNLQKDPADYPEMDGAREVDGFRIERIAA